MGLSGYILSRQRNPALRHTSMTCAICAAGLLTRRANCRSCRVGALHPPFSREKNGIGGCRAPTLRIGQQALRPAAQSCALSAAALVILAATALAAGAAPAPDKGGNPSEAAFAQGTSILVLPITSEEKGLGDQVRLMLINKSRRLGAVTYDPGSVAEVIGGDPVPLDTPPEKLAALARDRFSADFIVLGAVTGKGPYAVRLVAVRATDPKKPQVLDKTYPCEHHQYIPLEMAKAVYEIFGLPVPEDPLRQLQNDPQVERRWRDGANLVRNPGFEIPNASGKGPTDWQPPGALTTGGVVTWMPNPDGAGKVIRYEMDEGTAGGYGMAYYSDWIAIEPGATYRFSCRYKSLGPTVKIFLKGYHEFPPQEGFPAQRRETYRRQVHPAGEKGQWNSVVADFIPSHANPNQQPTWMKVDLYAYWPKGVVFWDDIVLKKVRDAPAAKPAEAPAATDKEK